MEEQKVIGLDLSIASAEVLQILIDDAEDTSVFTEILNANRNRPEALKILLDSPGVSEEIKAEAGRILNLPVAVAATGTPSRLEITHEKTQPDRKKIPLIQRIQSLNVTQRRQLAMKGGGEVRSILLKDSNKDVILSVLDNPKLTESEVALIARSRSLPDEALRIVSKNTEWIKSYAVKYALICNPKAPAGITVGFVSALKEKDLKLLEKNKNVTEVIRMAAKRLLAAKGKN